MSAITGKKISQLPDPVVPVDQDAYLAIETSDGRVCKITPSALFSAANTPLGFIAEDFSGTILAIPVLVNSGKLPEEDSKIEAFTNGNRDYLTLDYTITRNAGATPDQVVFNNPRVNDAIKIRFTL